MKNKKLNVIIIIFLTLVVLYFALKDDYKQILALLFQANIGWIFIGYVLVVCYTFLKSLVTNEIINSFKEYGIIETFKLQLMTFFFNAITPFSSGGQPFQIYVLNKNKIKLTSATNIVVQETIIHQISLSIILIMTMFLNIILNIYNLDFYMFMLLLIGFLLNAVVIVFLFIIAYGKKIDNTFIKFIITILYKLKIIKNKDEKLKKWEENIHDFNIASKNLLKDKKKFIKLVFINAIAIVCLYLVPLTTLFSLGEYKAFDGIISIVLVSFVSIICCFVPLPGGAIGQEYLFALFFGIYIKNPLLSSLMILWRLITYYLPMIVGAIIFNLNKRNN